MWLQDQAEQSTDTKTVDEKWLKIPDPQIGKTSEVRLRVLDEEPLGVWRHWVGSRAYNCPGIERCPVCKVRMEAKRNNPEGYKADYPMDYRYYFNVLFDGTVKIWSFTNSVGRKLKVFLEKYGDLRDYDITVTKRKTGSQPKNVEYDVLYEGKSILGSEDLATSESKHDLTPFITPADAETLGQVAKGQEPVAPSTDEKPRVTKATRSDMIMLKALVEKNKFTLSDFGIVESTPPPKDVVEKLIEELKTEQR